MSRDSNQKAKFSLVQECVIIGGVLYGFYLLDNALQKYHRNQLRDEFFRGRVDKQTGVCIVNGIKESTQRLKREYYHLFVNSGIYIHRNEEIQLFDSLSQLFVAHHPFAVVVYGFKQIGKTHLINHVLYHHFSTTKTGKRWSMWGWTETNNNDKKFEDKYCETKDDEEEYEKEKLQNLYRVPPPFSILVLQVYLEQNAIIDMEILLLMNQSGSCKTMFVRVNWKMHR